MGSSLGEQGAANLRKLLEIARQPRGALRGSLESFTHGLAGLVADPPDDPQAPLMGEDAPVVRLMTIHQAKGLQFKVVVLADLDGQAGGSLGRGGLPASGPGGVVALAPRDAASGELQRSVLYKSLLARSRAREEAESARLFYVACTRAMERLAFVLVDGKRGQGRWGKWVREHVLGDQVVSEIKADSLSRSLGRETQAPAHDWPDYTPPSPGPLADQGAEIAARSLTPPRPAAPLARESVSSLENWFICPRLYFYTRRLGLDTGALAPAGGRGAGASPDLDPVTLGSAVHQVLELADLAAGPRGLESALTLVCQGMGIGAEQAEKIRSLAAGAWDTQLAEIISSLPPENLMREQPFRLNLEGGPDGACMEMIGEFDLLIVRERAPLIVDYKVTGDIHPKHYRDQLGLYALALWSGGQGRGPVPETALCYLRPQGARLEFLEFSERDLQEYRDKVLQAAAGMAAIPPGAAPGDLPPGPGCDRECALARAGVCRGWEPAG
jgi:ATP-dependent helicase/nuclease subunit A